MITKLFDRLLKDTKQGIINIDSNETQSYTRFINNGMECFIIATSGGYHVIYDNSNDRLIVAWLVRLYGHEFMGDTLNIKGDWCQGYYFENKGGNDIVDRYDLINVIELFVKKALS